MAAGRIVLSQYFPARDRNARLVSGALLYVYTNGTTTKASIYSNEALTTALANPVAANSSGQFPAIWASDAVTYTLSITDADGASIGNPSVFDNYSVSTDADTASVALAEAAAASAAADAVSTAADLADMLAVVATGSDAAAIAARAAKAANLSDLADGDAALANLDFVQAGTGATTRTAKAKLRDIVSPEDFGAVGDGVTDDTTAFQAAITSGKNIRGVPGSTYYCGPLENLTADQSINLHDCTMKLKAGSNSHQIILRGARAKVRGGTFDGNKAAGMVLIDGGYNLSGVCLAATGASVTDARFTNSAGLAIRGAQYNDIEASRNVVGGFDLQGIYFEGSTADTYGWRVDDNTVTIDAGGGVGIYLTGSNDNPSFTYRPKRWSVCGNRVEGTTDSGTLDSDVCITIRGDDGVCGYNRVYGGSIGISADITSNSTFVGNRVESPAGATAYCLELNGSYNTVSGNVLIGGRIGFSGSGVLSMSGNSISGNTIKGQSERCIFISPNSGVTARDVNISGNVLNISSAPTAAVAIYLSRDCKGALVSGNTILGPGVAAANSVAVYTDAGTGFVSVVGNKIKGFERLLVLYTATAVAHTNVMVNDNDCSDDMSTDTTFITVQGLATIGAYVVQRGNMVTTGARRDWLDRQNNVFEFTWDSAPEGALAGGIGSRVWRTTGGGSTTLYVKETGTGMTGWRPIGSYLAGSATYDAPSIAAGGTTTTTVTVTGAVLGDLATCSFGVSLAGLMATAYISAADTATVVLYNPTAGAIDLASTTVRVRAHKI